MPEDTPGPDPLDMKEVPVGVDAGDSATVVMPTAEFPVPTRDSISQVIEEGAPADTHVSSGDKLLQKQIDLLILIEQRLSRTDELLTRIDNREAAADVSRQSIPPVPQYSSSAWNPLLKSARERIDAIVDRWRGSLDVLLVFVGLFSAIVTSFFVDSVHNLSPDQAARTNELLANLTEIVIQISGVQAARLNITPSAPFVPDASDVRVNAYWSLALIISISAAALAVAGRAFLAVLTKSTGKPHQMLVDINQRWEEAERILGPALETLPVILTIPVLLFLIGLLDNIFSAAIGSPHSSVPVIVAASLSAIAILLVGVVLFYTLLHAYLHPDNSPFRTTISRYIYALGQPIQQRLLEQYTRVSALRLFRWISNHIRSSTRRIRELGRRIRSRVNYLIECIWTGVDLFIHRKKTDLGRQIPQYEKSVEADEAGDEEDKEMGSSYYDQFLPLEARVYHATLQATHDDDVLDQAAAAFHSICENSTTRKKFDRHSRQFRKHKTLLSCLEIKSLIHLLSPEASYRCNLTASESILRLNRLPVPETKIMNFPLCETSERLDLLDALRDAARREHSRYKGDGALWRSTFVESFAVLSHRQRKASNQTIHQPVLSRIVNLLNSDYIEETEGDGNVVGQRVSEMAFSVLYDDALQDRRSLDTTPESTATTFVNYLSKSLGTSSSIAPLTVTKCLSRWSGRSVFSDIPINWKKTAPSLAKQIWARSTPTAKDVLTLISWGACRGLGSLDTNFRSTLWVEVLQGLRILMKRQLAWPYFGTIPGLKSMIPHLGAYARHGDEYSSSPNKTVFTFIFSAVFEMLSWQLNYPLIDDQLVDSFRVDDALLHIFGPSPSNSFSPVDVAVCLACWDGTNIFTRSKTEPDLDTESQKSKSQKILVDAMVGWLWKEVPHRDIPEHVNHLTGLLEGFTYNYHQYASDVLMSLIYFENSRTRGLDITFSVLNGLRADPDAYRYNYFSLMAGLFDLIATHTHKTHGRLSREQAELLVSLYDSINTLSDDVLWWYNVDIDGAAVELQKKSLELLRTLWKDLYPDDHTDSHSIGPNGELLLNPHYFPRGIRDPLRICGIAGHESYV